MGQSLQLGTKTVDLKKYVADGVYVTANMDLAPEDSTSIIAVVLRALICFVPNVLLGSCNTVWAIEMFAPIGADFDSAYIKAEQPAETYSSQQFITAVGERKLEVVGFGSSGIQKAEASVMNIQVSFPTAFGPSRCNGNWLCNFQHRFTMHVVASYVDEGVELGKKISLLIAIEMNWVNPFGINGITITSGSVTFMNIWGCATNPLRNGLHVQMTTTFTLSSAEKALMSYEEAKAKARAMQMLIEEPSNSTKWVNAYETSADAKAYFQALLSPKPAAWPKAGAEEPRRLADDKEELISPWGHRHRPHHHNPHSHRPHTHIPTRPYTTPTMACVGHGYTEWECKALGCCSWSGSTCNAGSSERCENVDIRSENEACIWSAPNQEGNYDSATCSAIGCCKYQSSKCLPSSADGSVACINPLANSANVEAGGTLQNTGSQGGVAAVPASTDHNFALGVQLPIGDLAKIAAGFGVYFKAGTISAHDALKIAQKVAFGSIVIMPPNVLKKFTLVNFELALCPGGAIDFWMPGGAASCAQGLVASLGIQVFGVSATFGVSALMDSSTLVPSVPMDLSITVTGIAQLIQTMVDAIMTVICYVIPNWSWLTNAIRSFLEFFSIESFSFAIRLLNGVTTGFKVALTVIVGGKTKSFNLEVDAFESLLDIFKQWGAQAVAAILDFIDFPPFPNGYPCIPFLGICQNTCLFCICAPNNVVDAAINAVKDAAAAVGGAITNAASAVGAAFSSAAGYIGGAISGAAGAVGGAISGAAGAVSGFFGEKKGLLAYTPEEQRVLSHPNATQVLNYILARGPAANMTMNPRHMHSLIANIYDHSEQDVKGAYHLMEPHKNDAITWGQWRMQYAHEVIPHHAQYMQKMGRTPA